jgi:hypothetical protein
MKFNPDILLKIFLEGSLTPEAKAEFDRLVLQDPIYAEKVTAALAEKLGPLPDSQVDAIASRLEPKLAQAWKMAQPRPWKLYYKLAWKILMVVVALGALGTGIGMLLSNPGEKPTMETSSGEPFSLVILKETPSMPKPTSGIQSRKPVASMPVSTFFNASSKPVTPPPTHARNSQTEEGSFIRLAIHMDQSQKVWVRILDPNGQAVRNLYQGQWMVGDHTLDWDGKDDHGRALVPGTYQVTVQSGGRTQSSSVNLQQAQ